MWPLGDQSTGLKVIECDRVIAQDTVLAEEDSQHGATSGETIDLSVGVDGLRPTAAAISAAFELTMVCSQMPTTNTAFSS